MIKLNPSLRGALILAFVTVALVLVAGYSFLSARYFLNGMDTIMADNLVRVAKAVATDEDLSRISAFDQYVVTRQWQNQPALLSAAVPTPPPIDHQLKLAKPEGPEGQSDQLFFYMGVDLPNGPYYASFNFSPDRVSDMVESNARDSLVTLLVIGLGSALAVASVVWWLIRRVSQPVSRLGEWARGLNEKTLDQTIPDFGFRDLNDFAGLVRSSLISVKEGLDREQTFLRHASHEMRTPISVICNNIELLRKLKDRQLEQTRDPREMAVVERIDRAGHTMKDLTETLLWLGKSNNEALPKKNIRVDLLVRNLVSDLKYLLDGKNVELSVTLEPYSCNLPAAAAQIVLGNLIRNAFQHAWQGEIHIVQSDGRIEISNHQSLGDESADELSFGLGQQLAETLSRKLGWHYENKILGNRRIACVQF